MPTYITAEAAAENAQMQFKSTWSRGRWIGFFRNWIEHGTGLESIKKSTLIFNRPY